MAAGDVDAPPVQRESRAHGLSRLRFWEYAIWYAAGLIFCCLFGAFVAHEFMKGQKEPGFKKLDALIGHPLEVPISQEIIETYEKEIGPRPVRDERTGVVASVKESFRTGNLPKSAVHFLEWGEPVPYGLDGETYWAVPFRYEADFGFGSARQDTATALIRDGVVTRYLFVPFWNFMSGQGTY